MVNVKGEKFSKKILKSLTIILSVIFLLAGVLVAKEIVKKHVYPLGYKEQVFYCADAYDLDKALVFAVIKVESGFDALAKSKAGALGLMQITENTGKYIAKLLGKKDYDLLDPNTNIEFGCYYLSYLIVRFKNIETAICAYNAGEGNVSAWLSNADLSADGKTLKSIPFTETREYLIKIKKTFSKYKKLYGNILDK